MTTYTVTIYADLSDLEVQTAVYPGDITAFRNGEWNQTPITSSTSSSVNLITNHFATGNDLSQYFVEFNLSSIVNGTYTATFEFNHNSSAFYGGEAIEIYSFDWNSADPVSNQRNVAQLAALPLFGTIPIDGLTGYKSAQNSYTKDQTWAKFVISPSTYRLKTVNDELDFYSQWYSADRVGTTQDPKLTLQAAGIERTVNITATGSGTFTVPGGVTEIEVECWGAGGGGGWQTAQEPGGGGGAYAKKILAVTPGQQISYNVGVGGATGSAGGDTSFGSNLVLAKGGGGGLGSTPGSGGLFGASIGDTKYPGGDGAAQQGGGGTRGGSGGGAAAGSGGSGQAGTVGSGATAGTGGVGTGGGGSGGNGGSVGVNAQNGFAPGGGGGGKASSSSNSGTGARGQIRIYYIEPNPSTGQGSQIKYWNGSTWVLKPLKYWNGSVWTNATLKRWNGSAWITV